MTKTEKQILLETMEEYAKVFGYYVEQNKHSKDNDRTDQNEASQRMQVVEGILRKLGIKYGTVKDDAIREGSQLYIDNHPVN